MRKLEELASADPSLRPYADLLARALDAAADPAWAQAVVGLELHGDDPALHGARIPLPPQWEILAEGSLSVEILERALNLQPLDDEIGAKAQLALLPLLMAAGAACAGAVAEAAWQQGICPVCAAWPALAEARGIDRPRILRCGRCGSEWKLPWQLCPFCANDDHAALSYLVSDTLGEAKRVFACERCHGFLKTIATISAIEPLAVPVEDLSTLELDIAAINAGFQRPAEPGFELHAQLTVC